jgi:hypothetical protein
MWSPKNRFRLEVLLLLAFGCWIVFGQTTPGYTTQGSTRLIGSLIDATPIGNTTPATGRFTDVFASGSFHGNATTATALAGNALQSGNGPGCTTGTSSYATCSSTVPWNVGFADTGYNASCTIVSPIGKPTIAGLTKSTSGVTVTIQNGDANGAVVSGGTLGCVAFHP